MKIFSWNVNGYRAILKKDFTGFLAKYNPDILCLQEIKIQEDQLPSDKFFPYCYYNFAEKKGYSGVSIFSKTEPIKVEKINLLPEEMIDEGRIIYAEFEKFILLCCYTPNSKSDLSRLPLRYKDWGIKFANLIKELSKEKPVIVCGDLNVAHQEIDLKNPKTNHFSAGFTDEERQDFTDLLENAKLIDTFRAIHPEEVKYSWWSYRMAARSRNVGWRIDYFLSTKDIFGKIKSSEILNDVLGSDHCPVAIEIEE